MKIAITGPHCSGKSTLISRIKSELVSYKNVNFLEFSGVSCPIKYSEKSVINDKNSEIEITLWMLSRMLLREIELKYDKNYKNSISILDRCILDQIVYPSVNLDSRYVDIIEKFINLWIDNNPYDIVFYVPKNELFLKKVTYFNQDLDYLNEVEDKYFSVLNKLSDTKSTKIILPKNQDEQKDCIVSTIKNLLG